MAIMGRRRGGKGDDPGLYQGGMSDWAKGEIVTQRVRGEKGGWETRRGRQADFDRNFRPKVAKKSGTAGIYQDRELPASGNILDMPKVLTFEESIAQGTRADDPRNWEFYYKEPTSTMGIGGKDATESEKRSIMFQRARRRAEREAKLAGQEVFDTMRSEYETARIRNQMTIDRQMAAMKRGPGEFGSTRVARSVAAQKARAGRQMVTEQAGRTTGAATAQAGAVGTPDIFSGPTRAAAAQGGQTVARVARQGRRGRMT